jgi:surface antigen
MSNAGWNTGARCKIAKAFTRGVFALILPSVASADPPPWAPAHGWCKKHDPEYVGYTGKKWQRDYGVVTGRCDYEAVGAVVGGAVGAKVGDKEARPVAILIGAVIGSVVGARIGRNIEDADRACIGHSLELVKDHQSVAWKNPKSGISYLLTPGAGYKKDGRTCRNFDLRTTLEGRNRNSKDKTCQAESGSWQLVS